MKFDHGYKYMAIFQPKRLKTLRPELASSVGKSVQLTFAWRHDKRPYTNQAVFIEYVKPSHALENTVLKGHWVPREDLESLRYDSQ